jgi:transmembrane sensor
LENKFEHIEEVIARILSGEASPHDKNLVDEWVNLSAENARAFSLSKKLFEQSAALKNVIPVNTDTAWLKVKSRMDARKQPVIISMPPSQPWKQFLRIAALLLLVAGLGTAGYFLLRPDVQPYDVVLSAKDEVRNDTLPDGSSIGLNKNSTIAYSSAGFGKDRRLRLTGEAFFDVVHDEQNMFIVEAGGLSIEDVGTSFNVKAVPGSGNVTVAVVTGEVMLVAREKKQLHLVAGEQAVYDTASNSFSKGMIEDENVASYKDKNFIFDNTELAVIVKLLNDVYGKNILIENEELKKCRLTATFSNETLDAIVDVIAETLRLQVKRTETEILLNGNGCN